MTHWNHDLSQAPRDQENKSEIPEDVFQAAREALAAEYEREYPTYAKLALEGKGAFTLCSINAIAKAITAERNRCAELAKFYALACINAGYSEEASGAGYYACSQVEGEIRNPENHKAKTSVEIDEDDLPF